jgi:dihydrofolate reductase
MGRLLLQMMISADGMVGGPEGEMDWVATNDKDLEQDHLARLKQADAVIFGAGSYPALPRVWRAIADDEKAEAIDREIGVAPLFERNF